jgi:hypothetical protein
MKPFAPLSLFAMLAWTLPAGAQYAPPPDDRASHYGGEDDTARDRDFGNTYTRAEPSRSIVRLYTGPALRLGGGATRAGLLAAADIGRGAAGLRLSGTWIGTGTDQGLSLYGAELWIDFGKESDFHPIVAAGAALARADHSSANGMGSNVETASIGVALLRATLQYRLPVDGVDARAGLDLAANIRAFGPESYTKSAWAMAAATVGIGF